MGGGGEPRFPLAGDKRYSGRDSFQCGMSALADPTMAAQNSGASALDRDGLDKFSSSLFLDERLLDSATSTLIADADFIRYRSTMLRLLPGFMRRSGSRKRASSQCRMRSIAAGTPSRLRRCRRPFPQRRGHIRRGGIFWNAIRPRSPPATAGEPDRGHFLRCDLRTIEAPSLLVEGPDAAGAFTLQWIDTDTDLEFILEEATEPDFSDAVELWRGSETTFTILVSNARNLLLSRPRRSERRIERLVKWSAGANLHRHGVAGRVQRLIRLRHVARYSSRAPPLLRCARRHHGGARAAGAFPRRRRADVCE